MVVPLEPDHSMKIEMSKNAASTMYMAISGMPPDVQLEATILLLKSLMMSVVKPDQRLGLFKSIMVRLRNEIRDHLKTGVVR